MAWPCQNSAPIHSRRLVCPPHPLPHLQLHRRRPVSRRPPLRNGWPQALCTLVLAVLLAAGVLLQLRRAGEPQAAGHTHRPVAASSSLLRGRLVFAGGRCTPLHLLLPRRFLLPLRRPRRPPQRRRLRRHRLAALVGGLPGVVLREQVVWQRGDGLQRRVAALAIVRAGPAAWRQEAHRSVSQQKRRERDVEATRLLLPSCSRSARSRASSSFRDGAMVPLRLLVASTWGSQRPTPSLMTCR